MSNLTGVTNFFSTANEGFSTTLASSITAGATSMQLAGMATLTDGSVFVGIIDPGTVNQQTFTGTVSQGTTSITNVVWTRGANVAHVAGAAVVDYVTGTDFNMLSKGVQVSLTQQGKLNTSALSQIFPIGCIYTETTGTNPHTTFGFGTWGETGQGRVLVGDGTSDATYTGGTTGGSSTNTHNHWTLNSFDGSALYVTASGASPRTRVFDPGVGAWVFGKGASSGNVRQDSTYNETISIMPPYLVVYFWQRTA